MQEIWVRANDSKKFRGRIAIHEYDTAHITPDNPEGLLDISPCSESGEGYEPRHIYATPYVNECVSKKKLIPVPEPSAAEQKALLLAAGKKISVALAKQEIAAVQEQARMEIEAAKAETLIAEAEIAKAKAKTKKAQAKKAKAETRRAEAQAAQAEEEEKKAKSEAGS